MPDGEDECLNRDLYEMSIPEALKAASWADHIDNPVVLYSYCIDFIPTPSDRTYKKFALFINTALPQEAERMEVDLHLARRRSVMTKLLPSGPVEFNKDEVIQAQKFQEMCLNIMLDRKLFIPDFFLLGNHRFCSSTFYLLLPVVFQAQEDTATHVDWNCVGKCLSSPLFRTPGDVLRDEVVVPLEGHLQLANGCTSISDIESSLVYVPHKNRFYFITHIDSGTNCHKSGLRIKYPDQPLLCAKPLAAVRNLLHNRKEEDSANAQGQDEFIVTFPPELCELKIVGFSKDIGSSLSLLPSVVHRLNNLLLAVELKKLLSDSFPEGAEVTAPRVLEALTTEKCQEQFSLERLEVLGDAFLKFAVGRHLFLSYDGYDEGELTRKRSDAVNNSNLFKLATRNNLQVYICDEPFDPSLFFAPGRPCPTVCTEETRATIHDLHEHSVAGHVNSRGLRCSKNHHWLYKKTISDVVEALVGAFIVDSGFKATSAFLKWLGIQVSFEVSEVNNICIDSGRYLSLSSLIDIRGLESLLGYQFLHEGLLVQAFVHPSYKKHEGLGGCYQRLEFLGDAVLDYLMTSYLFSVYPKLKPGHLTDLRSASVNNKAFASVSLDQCFQKFLISDSADLTKAIEKYESFATNYDVLEEPKCPKVLGDLVESCLGAVLLDSGFNLKCVWKIMLSFLDRIVNYSCLQLHPIRELQELCQCHNLTQQVSTTKKSCGTFVVDLQVKGKDVDINVSFTNLSKKDAITNAAQHITAELKARGYLTKSKPLEEVLKNSPKMEALLLGYDETPVDVVPPLATVIQSSEQHDYCDGNLGSALSSPIKGSKKLHVSIDNGQSSSLDGHLGGLTEIVVDPNSNNEPRPTGGSVSKKGSARSCLYEICAANHWKPPSFECCNEEGPSNLKSFTCKVVLEIEATPDSTLECYGAPRTTKKDAAEHAAEALLAYLDSEGYLHSSQKNVILQDKGDKS